MTCNRAGFFKKSGAAAILSTHPHLSRLLFNLAVHAGVQAAVRDLQTILNLHNNCGKRWKDLLVDGWFGPTTDGIFETYIAFRRNHRGRDIIMADFIIRMGSRYQDICLRRERSEKYYYGWQQRILKEIEFYFGQHKDV